MVSKVVNLENLPETQSQTVFRKDVVWKNFKFCLTFVLTVKVSLGVVQGVSSSCIIYSSLGCLEKKQGSLKGLEMDKLHKSFSRLLVKSNQLELSYPFQGSPFFLRHPVETGGDRLKF